MKNTYNSTKVCAFCLLPAPGADIMIQSAENNTCICQACISQAVGMVAQEIKRRRDKFKIEFKLEGVKQ